MSDYARIMEENKALKAENDELKARIAELEKPAPVSDLPKMPIYDSSVSE